MRITKTIAEQTAHAMTAKSREKTQKLKDKLATEVYHRYMLRVPVEVKEAMREGHPLRPYLNTTDAIALRNSGFSHYMMWLPKGLFVLNKSGESGTKTIDVSEYKEADIRAWQALKNKITDAKDTAERLQKDIENLLYNLKTYAKVSEQFPEALEYLPKADSKALPALPIDDIRQRLKHL
jgi:hypothetical protein